MAKAKKYKKFSANQRSVVDKTLVEGVATSAFIDDIKLLPTQQEFLVDETKYVLYAGGWGTGKTTALNLKIIKELIEKPGNKGLLIRELFSSIESFNLPELRDTVKVIEESFEKKTGKKWKIWKRWDKQGQKVEFNVGGGVVSTLNYLGASDSRKAATKIQGPSYGFVAIDQIDEISENIWRHILGRLRGNGKTLNAQVDKGFSRQIFATANPNGHSWIWRRWVKKDPEVVGRRPEFYSYHQATTYENVFLPADYIESLIAENDERTVKRYVFSSWDEFSGLVYSEFDFTKNVVDPYVPEPEDRILIGIDEGWTHPAGIIFIARKPSGVSIVYDEIKRDQMHIEDLALYIKKIEPRWSNDTTRFRGDRSMWNSRANGRKTIDVWRENGINLERATNDRTAAIAEVNAAFRKRSLLVARNCNRLIDEIGDYVYKEDSEEPRKENDDLCDALRYAYRDDNKQHFFVTKRKHDSHYHNWQNNNMRDNRSWATAF